MQEVYTYSIDLTIEQLRIAHFLADGINTYTPRGHWKSIAATHFVQQHCSEARWARNIALLNMSLIDAAVVCWDAKSIYITPRPSQINPDIKTVTGIPNFPAYISKHSTFSDAASTTLSSIIPENTSKYITQAKEASMSRLYSAIYYRSDCEKGLETGN